MPDNLSIHVLDAKAHCRCGCSPFQLGFDFSSSHASSDDSIVIQCLPQSTIRHPSLPYHNIRKGGETIFSAFLEPCLLNRAQIKRLPRSRAHTKYLENGDAKGSKKL